jgi:hypothetical protein
VKYGAADLERIFADQLVAVGHALSNLGAQYMLIGGLAVGVWSAPRATKDCDLSVRVLATPEALRSSLEQAGLAVTRGDLSRALAAGEAVRLARRGRPEEPVVIDLLFAVTPFELEALSRRRPMHVLGVDLPVAAPDDLIVFKLIAGRPQDLVDARMVLDLHRSDIDLERVRRWCAEFGVESRVDALMSAR